ncbi:hypothetical protein HDU99_005221, partial [Rhizoclosmatium hyalinum]
MDIKKSHSPPPLNPQPNNNEQMLPSLNGLQATRQIKEAMPHMVVLGMSCVDVTEEDQETYMDVGMSGVVTKPIKFEELVEAVEECVGGVRNYLLD